MRIIGTGLSGLVGSRIVEMLSPAYQFQDFSRKTGVDITDSAAVINNITKAEGDYVLHCAAYTQVDAAEIDRDKGYESNAWKANVEGTRNVIEACEEAGKHLLFISTDMVFSGEKPAEEKYIEEEIPNPIGWYAITKCRAEQLITEAKIPWTILRIAYPYRALYEKKDYVRTFLSLLRENKPISAVTDHYFTPTFIDDLSIVLDLIFGNKIKGIYHAVSDEAVSPYEAAVKIAQTWGLNEKLINKTTREVYFKGRAPRGFNLSLNNDKIKKLGIEMRSFSEGLEEMKRQMEYEVK